MRNILRKMKNDDRKWSIKKFLRKSTEKDPDQERHELAKKQQVNIPRIKVRPCALLQLMDTF